jgi:AhpD family alkylhydroperoxidase
MHTATAKKMAETRHQYMEQFLVEFLSKWQGEK